MYVRSLSLYIPPVAVIALGGASTGVWLAVAIGGLLWLQGFLSVVWRLRREGG